jgi:hypothetical protein
MLSPNSSDVNRPLALAAEWQMPARVFLAPSRERERAV